MVSVADPNISDQYIRQGETDSTKIEIRDFQEIFLFVTSTEGEDLTVTLEKLTYRLEDNTTSMFESPGAVVDNRELILQTSGQSVERLLDLEAGTYELLIETDESGSIVIGYFNFNLGLLVAMALAWVLFSLMLATFFIVLPFWIIGMIMNIFNYNFTTNGQKHQPKTAGLNERINTQSTRQPTHQVSTGESPSSRPSFTQGTPFEKLTRKDLMWLSFAVFLFFVYLSGPFDREPFFFFSIIIGIAVTYNYFEREKTKARLLILLNTYPKASIAFFAEQLDKKEDYLIEVLRIMILDEGHPIRLDLINRSVIKVEQQPIQVQNSSIVTNDLNVRSQQTEVAESQTVEEKPVQEEVSQGQVQHGDRGQVTEPWAYCQQCGEGLKQKIKYCYICGARQFK